MNVKGFVQLLGCNVCLLEYRGYGHSDGSPHEEGLYLDAQAALEYLIGRPDVDQRKIIVFGRSLGESFYQTGQATFLCSVMVKLPKNESDKIFSL